MIVLNLQITIKCLINILNEYTEYYNLIKNRFELKK